VVTRRTAVIVVLAVMVLASCTADTADRDGAESTGTTEPAVRAAVDPTGETRTDTVSTPDGRTRGYLTYVPASLVPGEPAPLLVALHGGTGHAGQFQRSSGFDAVAEANGVIVVYPEGFGIDPDVTFGPATRSWNGGTCCGPAARADVDDVAFIEQVIDEVERTYPVDPDRVYATGHSNGAIMSYRLACEAADRVAAVAVFAGTLSVEDCRPVEPVSLLHIHGAADRNLPFEGGVGPESPFGIDHTPAMEGLVRLAAQSGCAVDPTVTASATNPEITTTRWAPCLDETTVELVMLEGAGHAWPGSEPGTAADAVVGQPYAGYDASTEIVAFLLAHPSRR
jgi:polyhydroxybutyrate depolymerase